jgi:hypothetical protein
VPGKIYAQASSCENLYTITTTDPDNSCTETGKGQCKRMSDELIPEFGNHQDYRRQKALSANLYLSTSYF